MCPATVLWALSLSACSSRRAESHALTGPIDTKTFSTRYLTSSLSHFKHCLVRPRFPAISGRQYAIQQFHVARKKEMQKDMSCCPRGGSNAGFNRACERPQCYVLPLDDGSLTVLIMKCSGLTKLYDTWKIRREGLEVQRWCLVLAGVGRSRTVIALTR